MISKRPERPTIFLDESIDAESVAAALQIAGAKVERAKDHFSKGTADETWLGKAGKEGWIVLTRDKRIRYRALEVESLREANVRAFVFTGGNVTAENTATILAEALPKITRISESEPAPFIYHIGLAGVPRKVS